MQKHTSKNTAVNKDKVPAVFTKVDQHFGWEKGTINFDLGGGPFASAVNYLGERGVTSLVYDPYNRTAQENYWVIQQLEQRQADTVTLSNVLNIIDNEFDLVQTIAFAKEFLKEGGKCYITCYNSGKKGRSKKDCWQQGEPLDWYIPYVKAEFSNVEKKYGMLIATK